MEVDPRARLSYAWFYILGFRELLGRGNVTWSTRWRGELPPAGVHSHDQYVALVLHFGGSSRKVIVDFRDLVAFDEVAYDWSDLYCKVNLDSGDTGRPKVIPLGPGFGVGPRPHERAPVRAVTLGASAHLRDRRAGLGAASPSAAKVLRDVARWQTLPDLAAYRARPAGSDRVFYAASLWGDAASMPSTDPERAAFMRAARASCGDGFQGGLVGGSPADRAQYPDLLLDHPIRRRDWIDQTAASAMAFNNPAVWGCLGWKLGQYLALGKAIISTPLENVLPEPLEHGRNVHLVGSVEEIPAAIDRIRTDDDYRLELERGALAYWHRWLAPTVVAARILAAAESS